MTRAVRIVGWSLLCVAFLSAIAVAFIALFQNGTTAVSYSTSGRSAMFLPIAYVTILAGVIAVGAALLIAKLLAALRGKKEQQ